MKGRFFYLLAQPRNINQEALHNLKSLAEELIPDSFKVSFLVSENHLQFTLQKLLEESFYNIIFAGIKGAGLLKKIFIRSVAVQIINSTKNIIVAMPKEITVFSHKKILVAVAEKYPLNISELNKFLFFVSNRGTDITFFIWQNRMKKQKIQKNILLT